MLFSPGAPREAYFVGFEHLADLTGEERARWFIAHDNFFIWGTSESRCITTVSESDGDPNRHHLPCSYVFPMSFGETRRHVHRVGTSAVVRVTSPTSGGEHVTTHETHDTAEALAWQIRRRTFIGASITVGGAMTLPLLASCSTQDVEPQAESTTVRMSINGEQRVVDVDNRTSLLDMLRERVGLTGTKKGCDQGACGACTIHLNGERVVSCLTLAVMHDGAEITTIEGLEDNGRLHPLQQAFIDRDALQCGYCTPGQIMSGVACIREGHANSPEEIRESMSGNICRCGAYVNIVDAVAAVARQGE